jgi:hypothetical protein
MKRDVLQPPRISYACLAMEILGLKIGVGGVGVRGRGTKFHRRQPGVRPPETPKAGCDSILKPSITRGNGPRTASDGSKGIMCPTDASASFLGPFAEVWEGPRGKPQWGLGLTPKSDKNCHFECKAAFTYPTPTTG